jgi:LmbE family N-acetylglucosaminyl deacetylase
MADLQHALIGTRAATSPRVGPALLAVFAHPDDEVLCAGGTLALCRARGQHVTVVCATRGEFGPVADPGLLAGRSLSEVREGELRASCAVLGVDDVRVLGLPDSGVQWAAHQQGTLGVLVDLIVELRPDVIVTFGPDGLYGHTDHVAVGELVTEARSVAARGMSEDLAQGDRHAAPRLFFPVITAQAIATVVDDMARAGLPSRLWSLIPSDFLAKQAEITASIDVSSVLDRKLEALRSHRSQLEDDHLFLRLTPALAANFFGMEHFRCADGRPGDPLHG